VDDASQERTRRQNDRPGFYGITVPQNHSDHTVASHQEVHDLTFEHHQIRSLAKLSLDRCPVERAVGLHARTLGSRPLPTVQKAELDSGDIGRSAHNSIERVDLAHDVTFAQTADCRVARHLAESVEPMRHERRSGAHAIGRHRRLATGMPSTYHQNVEPVFHVKHSLLAEAKALENHVQDGLYIHFANQKIKRTERTL
jgi:hypothetical protein